MTMGNFCLKPDVLSKQQIENQIEKENKKHV